MKYGDAPRASWIGGDAKGENDEDDDGVCVPV